MILEGLILEKIILKNIGRKIKKNQIFENINMEICLKPQRIYGFVGPNGSGKTTLMKLISGLYFQNKGEIQCTCTKEAYDLWARSNISYIPSDERGIFYKNTIFDNALYYGVIKGVPEKRLKKNIQKYAQDLDIIPLLNKRVEELSTGQKKKAQLLAALSTERKLLLLDEPSSGLDLDALKDLKETLLKIVSSVDTSIIVSSHDTKFLSDMIEHYFFLFNGTIIEKEFKDYDSNKLEITYHKLKGESNLYGDS